MGKETRHLWVENLPAEASEGHIKDFFQRIGRVQRVTRHRHKEGRSASALVSFVEVKSAVRVHNARNKFSNRNLYTQYYDPQSETKDDLENSHITSPAKACDERLQKIGPHGYDAQDENEELHDRGSTSYSSVDLPPSLDDQCSHMYETDADPEYTFDAEKLTKDLAEYRARKQTRSNLIYPEGINTIADLPSCSVFHVTTSMTIIPDCHMTNTDFYANYLYRTQDSNEQVTIRVDNLPNYLSAPALRDALFIKYKSCGKIMAVKICAENGARYGLITFARRVSAERACKGARNKMLLNVRVEVSIQNDHDKKKVEFDDTIDEYHPEASKTLFVENLDKSATIGDIRNYLEEYGTVVDVGLKKSQDDCSALIQYSDITSVVRALTHISQQKGDKMGVSFGQSVPTSCVWVAGIEEGVTLTYICQRFAYCGGILTAVLYHRKREALIWFKLVSSAKRAVTEMHGTTLKTQRLQVDFANLRYQEYFINEIKKCDAIA